MVLNFLFFVQNFFCNGDEEQVRSDRLCPPGYREGIKQCCGTIMIYCSSGSYLGKVLVPVQNLAFSMLEAALFP
jgi:hypothetical protein